MLARIYAYLSKKKATANLRRFINIGEDTDITGIIDKRSLKSTITVGKNCLIQGYLVTETDGSEILIGNNVFIGGGTLIDCASSITIQDDVLISYQCILVDSDNHSLRYSIRKNDLADWRKGKFDWSTTKSVPIKISKGAWVGARAIILKGVTIGEGVVVGAGSVVTKDVPSWTVVAGNPARVIREIAEHER